MTVPEIRAKLAETTDLARSAFLPSLYPLIDAVMEEASEHRAYHNWRSRGGEDVDTAVAMMERWRSARARVDALAKEIKL